MSFFVHTTVFITSTLSLQHYEKPAVEPEERSMLVQLGVTLLPGREGTSASTMLAKLPGNSDELAMLCDSVGLQTACDALKGQSPAEIGQTSYSAQAVSSDHLKAEFQKSKCMPAGKLVFMHVMKTGGLSIDSFLHDACNEHPNEAVCSIQRLDFPPHALVEPWGGKHCEPSICTIGDLERNHCPGFDKAKKFTIMRDPVDRVWSFYSMLRQWYKPYQENTLKWILRHPNIDLNKGLTVADVCIWCKDHLSDAMVNIHFGRGQLSGAKTALEKFDLVMDVHALGRFPELAAERKLFTDHPSLSGRTKLTVPHENDHVAGIPKHPDRKTKKLIAEFNKKDALLYKYAKTMRNYVA